MKKVNFKLPLKYIPQDVEVGRYQWWIDNGLFNHHAQSKKKPYTILMPPPNITGKLHLGHAWDGYLEDVLIRYKKLNGYDTLFIPGMDHAGIATQAKVESYLREEKNLNRLEMQREDFLEQIWKWKQQYSATIRQQWAKLGLALNYELEKFTLDKDVNDLVNYVFIYLYEKGLIYRGKRIVNWDPKQKTAISNIEVIYKEVPGSMYFFRYPIAGSKEYLEVATTRPETMFADQALAVNPKDERYHRYIGEKAINPINQQKIPILGDEYVDKAFGTGVMKVTPAHDFNDFEIGKRHGLKMPKCINDDGSMNDSCGVNYAKLDRLSARDLIVKTATQNGSLYQIIPILHTIGFSERSDAIVEPLLSNQWFVKTAEFSKAILNLQESQEKINFIPYRFNDVLKQWMSNPQDWTISRQLWWGHRIPAWYNQDTKEIHVGLKPPNKGVWIQDPDVLDTWFSSSLWPLAVLQWKPEISGDLFKRHFPMDTLVTGYDIIFFWVARMMFQSLELVKQKPFKNILIHGLIRDSQGRKMSKSLNNGIDPMEVIAEYGSDALRVSLLIGSTPGQDLKFNSKRIAAAWNFLNKLWNISSYVFLQLSDNFVAPNDTFVPHLSEINIKIWSQTGELAKNLKKTIDKFDFGGGGTALYHFIWDDFASNYLEQTKVILKSKESTDSLIKETLNVLFLTLKHTLILLHPYAPFITEYIYGEMKLKTSIMEENWPRFDYQVLSSDSWVEDFEAIKQTILNFRIAKNLSKKNPLEFNLSLGNLQKNQNLITNLKDIKFFLIGMTNATLKIVDAKEKKNSSLLVANHDYFLEVNEALQEDRTQLIKEQKRLESEIKRSESILKNPNFISKAKPDKVLVEQEKYQKYKNQLFAVLEKIKEINE